MKELKRAILVIFDGWGIRKERKDNAIAQARTPHFNRLLGLYPNGALIASGLPVGLPDGVMGNSEVGHTNIGSGRRVVQDQVRIHEAIAEGTFLQNPVLREAMASAKVRSRKLHLLGLVSQGNVHSAEAHYLALLDMVRREGVPAERVLVHAILDGRDTPPKSAEGYLKTLEDTLRDKGGRIATVSGRFYEMDRDKRWERTDLAYRALVHAEGECADSALASLRAAYKRGETDEFVLPTVILDKGGRPVGTMGVDDVVICFNFRPDRMRQIVRALAGNEAPLPSLRKDLRISLTTFTRYDQTFGLPVAFAPVELRHCFGEVVAESGLSQFRTAETEKYAHVTYFFNGGREAPFDREERVLIPSPKIKTYDLQPEMNSVEVTKTVVGRMAEERDTLIVVNFAQPDMVGHTGNFDAAVQAVEAGDRSIGEIVEATREHGFYLFITADHGNVEMMRDPATGQAHTAHTTNPVPILVVGDEFKKFRIRRNGALRDVAPTILTALDLPIPAEMDGENLLR